MLGIVVKKDGRTIDKLVRFGDEGDFLAIATEDAEKNGNTLDVYRDDDWNTFEAISVDPPESPDQTEWDAQKQLGPEAAISFLARKLGLE